MKRKKGGSVKKKKRGECKRRRSKRDTRKSSESGRRPKSERGVRKNLLSSRGCVKRRRGKLRSKDRQKLSRRRIGEQDKSQCRGCSKLERRQPEQER